MNNEIQLPENWELKTLDDVVESSLYGCNPETGENIDGVPYLRISDIREDGGLRYSELPENARFEKEYDKEKYTLKDGDFVIARSGASCGQSYVYDERHGKMVYASYLIRFELSQDIIKKGYIRAYLSSPLYWKQVNSAEKGAAQNNINAGSIKSFKIPVPPLDEQERIVDVVEERLTRLSRLQKSVQMVNELAVEYEKSLLSFLTIGRDVTEESAVDGIPENQSLPVGWDASQLSEVTKVNPRISYNEYEDYAYVPMDAVSADKKVITRYERRESLYSGLSKFCEGDIIVARITPCFENGKMAMASDLPDSYEFAVGSTEFVVIRPTDINPEYLFLYLKSPIVRQWGKHRLLGATGRERIKISQFRNELTVPVPPEETQSRIVQNIKRNDFDKIRMSVNAVQNMFREYEDSVLAHATKGKI
jgi:type I restriction enzyme S subunit